MNIFTAYRFYAPVSQVFNKRGLFLWTGGTGFIRHVIKPPEFAPAPRSMQIRHSAMGTKEGRESVVLEPAHI
jgi:hypothetical protein